MDLGILLHHAESTLFSWTHPDSEAKLWIYKYTKIGLVLDVKVICHHNVHGMEIQIPWRSNQSLGGHIQKLESLRGRVTIQRIRKSS